MKREQIIAHFREIGTWKRGDERAPHKPLLLLTELGRCSRGEPREVRYLDVEEKVGSLLREYGPPRKSYHPEYPFLGLQSEGIWTVLTADLLVRRLSNSDHTRTLLRQVNPTGTRNPEAWGYYGRIRRSAHVFYGPTKIFVHYNSTQCRALTVRKAARIQTFAGNYCLMESLTAQNHQVGKAAPPISRFRSPRQLCEQQDGLR